MASTKHETSHPKKKDFCTICNGRGRMSTPVKGGLRLVQCICKKPKKEDFCNLCNNSGFHSVDGWSSFSKVKCYNGCTPKK